MTEISIVTVTYNSRETIGEAFRNLESECKNNLCEWIVVDNDSKDGTADYIEKEFSWIKLIKSSENLGFGRGNNLGFKNSQSPYVLFLNPDAAINYDAIQTLCNFLKENESAAITAPAIIEPSGSLQPSFLFPTPFRILIQATGLNRFFKQIQYIEPDSKPNKVDWIGGAIFMIKRQVFEQLNGFDPRFFLYWEETDLCLRASQKGWGIWTIGKAVAGHINAVCAESHKKPMFAGCISEHFFQSRYYYFQKHYGKIIAASTEISELILLLCFSTIGYLFNRSFKTRFKQRMTGTFLQLPADTK